METNETPSKASTKKPPARKGRKSKGKAPKTSKQKVKPPEDSELNVTAEGLDKSVESSSLDMVDLTAEIVTKEKIVTETVTETLEIGQKSKGKAVTNSKQKANIEDDKKDENSDKSVEMNIENIDSSEAEVVTKIIDTKCVETGRKSRGKAAKNSKKKSKSNEDSELNFTGESLDKSAEMMTKNAENVELSKKGTITKEVVKPVERHEKNSENVERKNVTERMEMTVNVTTENRLESDNSKSVCEADKVLEEQTNTFKAKSESDYKDNVDLDKSKKQKAGLDKSECSAADKIEDSGLPVDRQSVSKANNQSDVQGKLEVKDLTETLEKKQCTVQNENSPKPELPGLISGSAMDTEETQMKAKESSSEKEKRIETLVDEVSKKNDKPLTDADGQKDPKVKESEHQKRNDNENTAELNDRCADVGLVSVSDTHKGDSVSVEKVQSNSDKELGAKTSKTDKSNVDNEKNNDSVDKGAIAVMEDSRDSDVIKVSKTGESQTEINTSARAVEDASKCLKQPDDSLGKEAAALKENLVEPHAAKVSAKQKTDMEVKIENAVEKDGQMSADSESTPQKYDDTMETEGKSEAYFSHIMRNLLLAYAKIKAVIQLHGYMGDIFCGCTA